MEHIFWNPELCNCARAVRVNGILQLSSACGWKMGGSWSLRSVECRSGLAKIGLFDLTRQKVTLPNDRAYIYFTEAPLTHDNETGLSLGLCIERLKKVCY